MKLNYRPGYTQKSAITQKPAVKVTPVYKPAVIKKDYGVWEKFYRIEVEDFEKTVRTDTENVWVIAYINPRCGGCVKFAVEWEKLTTYETIR